MNYESQNNTIHAHLIKFGSITSIQAIRLYTITRLSARIMNLRDRGVLIASEIEYDQFNKARHWARYTLKK